MTECTYSATTTTTTTTTKNCICTKQGMKPDDSYAFKTVKACCTMLVLKDWFIWLVTAMMPGGSGLWAAATHWLASHTFLNTQLAFWWYKQTYKYAWDFSVAVLKAIVLRLTKLKAYFWHTVEWSNTLLFWNTGIKICAHKMLAKFKFGHLEQFVIFAKFYGIRDAMINR